MAPPSKPSFVTPVVEDEEGRTITRTMRRSDKLKDLTDFYTTPWCRRSRGKRVDGGQTPANYEMEDGDRVHFFLAMRPGVFIAVTLQDLKGRRFTRTMRRTDSVRDVMDFYYAMVPAAGESHFIDSRTGKRSQGKQTPADLEMEDGDGFDVVPEIPHTPRNKRAKHVTGTAAVLLYRFCQRISKLRMLSRHSSAVEDDAQVHLKAQIAVSTTTNTP